MPIPTRPGPTRPGPSPPPEEYIRLARGSIYLDSALCAAYFSDTAALAAIVRDGHAYLLPLRGPAAGGLLLKVRNARGDRVVHADEFLLTLGIAGSAPERWVGVRWVPDMAGLLLEEVVPTDAN
jgi:hypothetical protein